LVPNRRARRDLEVGGVDVDRRSRRLEYAGCVQPEAREDDRPQDERAMISWFVIPPDERGLCGWRCRWRFCFFAPFAAQLRWPAYPEYRPKLTSY